MNAGKQSNNPMGVDIRTEGEPGGIKMDAEDLLRQVLGCILPSLRKRVLLFLGGGTMNMGLVAEVLSGFPLCQYSMVVADDYPGVPSAEGLSRLDGKRIRTLPEADEALRDAELVLVPVVSRNTLSKVALGIADDLLTEGIAEALMLGKEVIAIRDDYDPLNRLQVSAGLSANSAYNSMIAGYEQKLGEFGVKIINLSEFRETLADRLDLTKLLPAQQQKQEHGLLPQDPFEVQSSILTLADVQKGQGGKLIAKPGTIMTPLAKEYVDAHHIPLEFKEQ
jgi:hypothetical protein